jgi:hypothetical protein
MSREWSQVYTFDCGNDHAHMSPCPGHTLQIEVSRTSDTSSIILDGKTVHVMSDGEYDALGEAMDELRSRWAK